MHLLGLNIVYYVLCKNTIVKLYIFWVLTNFTNISN